MAGDNAMLTMVHRLHRSVCELQISVECTNCAAAHAQTDKERDKRWSKICLSLPTVLCVVRRRLHPVLILKSSMWKVCVATCNRDKP